MTFNILVLRGPLLHKGHAILEQNLAIAIDRLFREPALANAPRLGEVTKYGDGGMATMGNLP